MPRPKKKPREWTNDEVLRKLFPPEARREAKEMTSDQRKPSIKKKPTL
jgi:hypothetical protein